MLKGKQPVCDRDCFHCKFEDCIEDGMIHEDYVQQSEIEKTLLFPKNEAQKKIAAGKKAYYEANREKIAAGQKAYREANREKYNQYMREYMRKRKQAEVGQC